MSKCVPAPRRIALDLQIEPNERLVKIERVTHANGTPIALMTNYLLPSIAPGIEKRIAGMSGLYSFLESEYNLVIEAATDFISARDVTPAEAEAAAGPRALPAPGGAADHSQRRKARRGGDPPGRGRQVRILRAHEGPSPARCRCAACPRRIKEWNRMTLTARDVAQLIDISAVQAPHGAAEIRGLVESAKEHHFIAVHVLPCWVGFLEGPARRQPRTSSSARRSASPAGPTARRSRWRRRSC